MKTVNLNDSSTYFASDELLNELKSKIKEGDIIINFAYTDYGGDFFDKICCEYFEKNHPDNFISENTMYYGQNGLLFGDVAKEFQEVTERYLLGFNDIEEYFFERENEEMIKGFEMFKNDIETYNNYECDTDLIDWLCEEKSGCFNVLTTGLDFCESDLIDFCEENNKIRKVAL